MIETLEEFYEYSQGRPHPLPVIWSYWLNTVIGPDRREELAHLVVTATTEQRAEVLSWLRMRRQGFDGEALLRAKLAFWQPFHAWPELGAIREELKGGQSWVLFYAPGSQPEPGRAGRIGVVLERNESDNPLEHAIDASPADPQRLLALRAARDAALSILGWHGLPTLLFAYILSGGAMPMTLWRSGGLLLRLKEIRRRLHQDNLHFVFDPPGRYSGSSIGSGALVSLLLAFQPVRALLQTEGTAFSGVLLQLQIGRVGFVRQKLIVASGQISIRRTFVPRANRGEAPHHILDTNTVRWAGSVRGLVARLMPLSLTWLLANGLILGLVATILATYTRTPPVEPRLVAVETSEGFYRKAPGAELAAAARWQDRITLTFTGNADSPDFRVALWAKKAGQLRPDKTSDNDEAQRIVIPVEQGVARFRYRTSGDEKPIADTLQLETEWNGKPSHTYLKLDIKY